MKISFDAVLTAVAPAAPAASSSSSAASAVVILCEGFELFAALIEVLDTRLTPRLSFAQ